MDKYQPIACEHYDHIELACIRQRPLIIEFSNGALIQGTAINVETSANKCEWLTLETTSQRSKIRLDKIKVIHFQQEGFASMVLKEK